MNIEWNENFQKIGYTSQGCPLVRKFCKFAMCYSALVFLAAITDSELNISRKDDGDAYLKMETLKNHYVDKC